MHPRLNLHGAWRYELDFQDRSIEEWENHVLNNRNFIIPGTTASNKVGNPVILEQDLSKESVKCLREEYKYTGAAFYQTEFELDQKFADKKIELIIERVIFESVVWIDEQMIGRQDSLSAPHAYDITKHVEIGKKHTLTIRIDNRDIQNIGPYPSAYTDETQTIWNGMVGRVEIVGLDKITIKDVIIGLKSSERHLFLSFDTEGIHKHTVVQIDVSLTEEDCRLATHTVQYEGASDRRIDIDFILEETIQYWDEFTPKLYEMVINISNSSEGKSVQGSWYKKIGLKEITSKDAVLYINGSKRFLRGNIDCCVYPLTAYPPMNYEAWAEICKTVKEYGMNHIRFHSWCPPEAAFAAADEAGLYLQVEGPVWMDNWTGYTVGCHKEHYTYLEEEALRIISLYSHHPSFCIFSNGNELNGDFQLLEGIITSLKRKNPFLLYTLSTNWDRKINPIDDIIIAQSVDGVGIRGQYFPDQLVEGATLNYQTAIKERNVPVISHEVGQYVVYPNVNETNQYTGVLKPVNLESIKKNLLERKLYSYVPKYIKASGKLAALLYKSEIEAALRTEGFGGIQLLGLHDFPGQSTATIGLLDCFYKSKNIISPEEYRTFCNSTVLLVNMPKYRYTTDEDFRFELQIAHYGKEDLLYPEVEITLEHRINDKKEVFWKTNTTLGKITVGLNKELFCLKEKLFTKLKGRNEFTLTVRMSSMEIWNAWDIWVYEEEEAVTFPNAYESLDETSIARLEAGENVILFPKQEQLIETGPGKFFPVFWSPVHFTSQDPCGMIIHHTHPLFHKYYPVKDYADIEWKNLLEHSFLISIDSLDDFEPITMPVPNFFHNHKFTNLFEARVLNGKVLICSLNLEDNLKAYPEIRSFRKALRDYFVSEDFSPSQVITREDLQKLFLKKEDQEESSKNVAQGKAAFTDSEKSAAYGAMRGNDGDPLTMWIAADTGVGHYWMVDLEKECDISGTKVTFLEKGNFRYVIQTSLDGQEWKLVVNQTGQTKEVIEGVDSFKVKARYVKIIYNGLPDGVSAGHKEFEVYEKHN